MTTSESQTEKYGEAHIETLDVARAGVAATDDQGHALIQRDVVAEAKLRLKMDVRILPLVAILYLFCFIDRSNVGNARLAGLEKSLGMSGNDYNTLASAFYVAYAVFEIPMLMLCKRVGPGIFIPISTFLFGLFSMCTGFCNTFGAAIAVRFLLGISEGAVFPGIAYYLSRFYRKDELAFRLSMYVVSAPLAGAFGGLLASGILKLDGFGMVREWRMIFVIEGIVTMGLGIIAIFIMTDRPETASWLTEEEKALAAARIKSENVGSRVVIDNFNKKAILQGMFSPTTIMTSLVFCLDNITVQGLGFFLPTIIRTIYPTRSTIYQQLRTVPPYVVGAVFCVGVPFAAWKTNRRLIYMICSAPFVMVGYIIFITTKNPHARYGATFLIGAGAFSFGAMCNSLVSANTTSDSMRAGAIAVNVGMGNLGGLIATWTYLPHDGPNYHNGNSTNLGTSTGMLVLCCCIWAYHVRQNRRKEQGHHDHVLEGKSPDEIEHLGRHHPGFRYHN